MTCLPPDQLEWLGIRFLDPNGRVFRWQGEIYRAIYPQQVPYVLSLFERGIIGELIEKGLLISTELTKLKVDGFGLVLRHRTLPYITRPWEWNRSFIRDAALTILDLNLALLKWGLSTIDGHGHNIGQTDCCRPIWLDLGSIIPLTNAYQPLPEFRRYFTRPLELLQRAPGCGKTVRGVIESGGLEERELISILHSRAHPKRAIPGLRAFVEGLAWRYGLMPQGKTPESETVTSISTPSVDLAHREELLHKERDRLTKFRFALSYTQWGNYYTSQIIPDDYDAATGKDPRKQAILQVIRDLRPRRVIDLAANAGFFSFFAARQGADVLAVDYDEGAIERLYQTAQTSRERLSISCACQDVLKPPATERRADLVLALALTHHLAIPQEVPFDIIVQRLTRYVDGALLVEFMPNGLGGTTPRPNPLPEKYTLENFLASLRQHFHSVEIVDYPFNPEQSRRVLVLAREQKNPAVP